MALILLIVLALAVPQDRLSEVAVDEVLATVDGAPILASEIDRTFDETGGQLSRGTIVRQLVLATLFEAHARDAELTVSDSALEAAMAERVKSSGGPDEYRERLAELGLDFESDRVRIRDSLLVEEYVEHTLGRVAGSPLLRPHLARMIHVTPREVQDHYRDHRESYRADAYTDLARLLIPKASFGGAEEARRAAESARESARGSPGALERAAEEDPRFSFSSSRLSEAQRGALRADIEAALDECGIGAPTPVLETPSSFVVLLKTAEAPSRIVPFAEAQPIAFAILTDQKARKARVELSRELLREADVWPKNLFPQDLPDEDGVAPPEPPP